MRNLCGKIKRSLRCQWNHFLWNLSYKVNRDWFDHVRFKISTGRTLDYQNPQWLNDKLAWLNRYWMPRKKVLCADKLGLRDYLQTIDVKSVHTPTIFGIWQNAEDIDFSQLPQSFVLKCNHGCGYNIVVKDKALLNIPHTVSQLNVWLKEDYGKRYHEYHYSYIHPAIFAEEYMSDLDEYGSIVDYKLMCVWGVPLFFLICRERNAHGHAVLSSYTLDWKRANYLKSEDPKTIPAPHNLDIMITAANRIAQDFPFVRVDFYDNYGKVYVGELTFTPEACLLDYCKDEILEEFGKSLQLPSKVNDYE